MGDQLGDPGLTVQNSSGACSGGCCDEHPVAGDPGGDPGLVVDTAVGPEGRAWKGTGRQKMAWKGSGQPRQDSPGGYKSSGPEQQRAITMHQGHWGGKSYGLQEPQSDQTVQDTRDVPKAARNCYYPRESHYLIMSSQTKSANNYFPL